jgi:uncharacterized membrane protein
METATCSVSGKEFPFILTKKGEDIPESLYNLILQSHPEFSKESRISIDALNSFRKKYLSLLIEQEVGDVNQMERDVIESIAGNKLLSENIEVDIDDTLSVGQRLADKIAEFGGSWTFIIVFFSFLLIWMAINIWWAWSYGKDNAFDPFPFILLNLILSCLSAIQAPIIMMSQNRQEQKDRLRSEHDYKVNLKAELEIRMLHEKIDHLLIHQNKRLLDIQQIQADYLEDILETVKKSTGETG